MSASCKRNLNNNPRELQGKREQVGGDALELAKDGGKLAGDPAAGPPTAIMFLSLFVELNAAHSALFICLGEFWQFSVCSRCKSLVCGQITEKQPQHAPQETQDTAFTRKINRSVKELKFMTSATSLSAALSPHKNPTFYFLTLLLLQ